MRPAVSMMYLVLGDQPRQISARVNPVQIEQVFLGQGAPLVFSTLGNRITPTITGEIVQLSANDAVGEVTDATYYEAVIRPDRSELAALDHVTLLPGMPVEAVLKTEDRTPLNYITQPLTVYFDRAFGDD